MNPRHQRLSLDRYARIGDLTGSVQRVLQRMFLPLAIVLLVISGGLLATHNPGTMAFVQIAIGTIVLLALWRANGIGLPLIPLIALQNLIIYGLPIVIGHEVIYLYPESFVTQAGFEVLLFSGGLAVSWRISMGLMQPASPLSYALRGLKQDGTVRLTRLGFTLITLSSLYLLCQSLGLLDAILNLLPAGSTSLVAPLVSATATCGFFLVSMFIGTGHISPLGRIIFWSLLMVSCLISASGFLLSATTTLVASVLIGLFWGSGRLPWKYLTVVLLVLGFLNLGKFTMRERYWGESGELEIAITLGQMPRYYAEWAEASYAALLPADQESLSSRFRDPAPKGQSLLERVNNLQNLLFVIDAVEVGHIAPLHGATYSLIPPLFVPRIFWPDKPRTHEGQILLNVHFGRQEMDATAQTYIAWGLLPEAYGNFGAMYGALFLGTIMGIFSAALENFTKNKLLISLEGFISFMILLGMMGSFEMVASVLLTAIFQSAVVLVLATLPFVERTVLKRPGTLAA
ncbi:MAG: hypothetical protein ABI222_14985 [Opitutaceae bacterium]